MQGWGGYVMQGCGGSCRDGAGGSCSGGVGSGRVGHAVVWCEVGCVMIG